jgi:hypothetical protein
MTFSKLEKALFQFGKEHFKFEWRLYRQGEGSSFAVALCERHFSTVMDRRYNALSKKIVSR